jgi:hypothetical protein
MTKIAGLTLAGFVAASVAADKVNLNPLVSQIAGFAGAFLGTLAGGWQAERRRKAETRETEKTKAHD